MSAGHMYDKPVAACMQASHINAQKQLQRTSQNLADSITSIDTFEEQLQSAGGRYTFLQETKAYIADLCDMLQVKAQPFQPGCACMLLMWLKYC